jgi:DNA repair exonuclease SbcCD ATPase subunit
MRLVRLAVERFQCIEAADVELGPGLNVLFGPNDLGKSSLAWAIRAVLLLQHTSTAHERFVSWYGSGEPRVALTLTDDDDRYWRVTKTFGSGTAGSSVLESSKNGQAFTKEASGRQVDDKLRTLLRWGLNRPGGRGAPHGLPVSFMTQVLLAEQDDVRKILFKSTLADDEEESGRLRLTQALGALAQDPLFKRVLDEAQTQVDRAFTSTGKRKRGVGSPFRDVATKTEELQQQRDELASKVRDTELAETRLTQLAGARDELLAKLDAGKSELAGVTARLAARQRHDELVAQRDAHQARIQDVEATHREIQARQAEAARIQAALTASTVRIEEVHDEAARAEARRTASRAAADELSTRSAATAGTLDQLEEREATARDRDQEAQRAAERARVAFDKAHTIARSISEAGNARRAALELSRQAAEASTAAAAAEQHARAAIEVARQELRDATGGDQARARELRRQELENRRLQLLATRGDAMRALERATGVQAAQDQAQAARQQVGELTDAIAKARTSAATVQATLDRLAAELAVLGRLQIYGQLHDATHARAAARNAAEAADREATRAATLRAEAGTLRGKVPRDLPAPDALEAMRRLDEDLRVAEARMGAVSVTIRPVRPIAIRVATDEASEPPRTIDAATSIVGRDVVIGIEGVAELEVTGGDPATRTAVSALRERWARECAPVLALHRAGNLAHLAQLRRDGDRMLADAEARERDARQAEELAARQRPTTLDDLAARCAELEAELGSADLAELAARFGKLGTGWAAALKGQIAKAQRDRDDEHAKREQLRTQQTRLEAQLEGLVREAETKQRNLTDQAESLGDPWSTVAERSREAIAQADRDGLDLDRALRDLAGAGSGDEAKARAAVAAAEAALVVAQRGVEAVTSEAQRARDSLVTAQAQLDVARSQARELDHNGFWQATLMDEIPELSTARWRAELDAASEQRQECSRQLLAIRDELAELARLREHATARARDDANRAEADAAAARQAHEQLRQQHQLDRDQLNQAQIDLAELRVRLAGVDVVQARAALASLQAELEAIGAPGDVGPAEVDARTSHVERLSQQLRDAEDELAKSRGALEQVGGAIVREQIRELEQAIHQHQAQHRSLELEFDAWQLLVETLRTAESSESQHLGRQLAGPVSRRFQQLTDGRYGPLELGADLEAEGLYAAGGLREIAALSAGTQDQLATLLRLCIAEQLKSAIVLDDHLSQSDPERVAWFNDALRAASPQLQIVFITCRPSEVLSAAELPAAGETFRISATGLTRAIDMTRVIRRFAASTRPGSAPTVPPVEVR